MTRSTTSSRSHHRLGCIRRSCQQYFIIPIIVVAISSIACFKVSESQRTPSAKKNMVSTMSKNNNRKEAVRRIVYFQPQEYKRSLQGNKVDVPTKSPVKTPAPSANPTLAPSFSPTLSPSFVPSTIPSATPSLAPSSAPSDAPSSVPSVYPSAYPTISSQPSAAPIPYQRTDRVEVRYIPWSELSTDIKKYALQLDYNQTTWNAIGTNPIEKINWSRLERDQQNIALQLGYERYSWDCWQNHFEGYRWVDLSETFVQAEQWWTDLGWDIYTWNKYEAPPPSDGLKWYELSSSERFAAAQLCYSRTTWDGEEVLYDGFPIMKPEFRFTDWMGLREETRRIAENKLKYSALSWNVLGLDAIEGRNWDRLTEFQKSAAESIGFVPLSWDCWQNHFRGYSWDDLVLYGLDHTYSTLGWNELSWDGVELPPASEDKAWKELTEDERAAAAEVCYLRYSWDMLDITPHNGQFLFPKVKLRFVEWEYLPEEVRTVAYSSLMYNSSSWNYPGTAAIEKKRWDDLTDKQRADAGTTLGFYERTWDCFQNHYRDYAWDELDKDGQDALRILGWNDTTWEAKAVLPPSASKDWDQLSENEQSNAAILCYFADNWKVGTRLSPDPLRSSSVHSMHFSQTKSLIYYVCFAMIVPLLQQLLF